MPTIREFTVERIKPFEKYIIEGFRMSFSSHKRDNLECMVDVNGNNIIIGHAGHVPLATISLARAYEYAMAAMVRRIHDCEFILVDALRRSAENFHQAKYTLDSGEEYGWMIDLDSYEAAWELLRNDMIYRLSFSEEEIQSVWDLAEYNIKNLLESERDDGGD